MHQSACLLSGFVLLLMSQATYAAKRLGPPIEDLQSAPDRIRIVVAEATEKQESSRILFSVSERLSGESPDELLLRTDEQTFADVEAGEHYLVAWTDVRKNRRSATGWEADPDGPSIVPVMGLGEGAVFEDTAEMRFLFAPGTIAAGPATASRQLDALLTQMQRPDVRSRGLVIAELYLRPDLIELMTPPQAQIVRDVLLEQSLDPQQLDLLLRAAAQLPQDLSSPWLAETYRHIIIWHGTQYDLASFVPGLVRTAARGLEQAGGAADIDLLGLLLYANNPGVAKAALASMAHIDSAAAIARAQQALDRGWIHSETRLALQLFLARSGQIE